MPGVVTTPLSERLARYDRIKKLRDKGTSLTEIGKLEGGLKKQRVAAILASGPPRW